MVVDKLANIDDEPKNDRFLKIYKNIEILHPSEREKGPIALANVWKRDKMFYCNFWTLCASTVIRKILIYLYI